MVAENRKRKILKLARIPRRLMRLDLERRLPVKWSRFKDLTGRKLERCEVLGLAGFVNGYSAWLCRCECGQLFVSRANSILHRPAGCGCGLRRHGACDTSEYRLWGSIIRKHRKQICRRWRDFVTFRSDVGLRPRPGYTLIRLDTRKAYAPGKVAWRPRYGHLGKRIDYGGKSLTVQQWADRIGISRQALWLRIKRCRQRGWDLGEALSDAAWPTGPVTQLPSMRSR
jgi:hypothetical protein